MTRRPHGIILVVMDTVRADHLSCYGYERPTSPFLSTLLEEAVLFRWAFSPSSYTLPVHASLFTGKLPSRHSASFDQATGRLDRDKEITLAELLSAAGYKTAAFVSALPLRKETGLNAGFEVYDDEMTSGELNRPQELFRNGDETNERLFRWLSQNHTSKFFVFCHYFDAHGPYQNPEPYASLFVDDGIYHNSKPRLLEVVEDGKQGGIPAYQVLHPVRDEAGSLLSYERDVRYYLAQYDAGIRRVDDCVAGLVSNLKALGIYDESLLIVTADHGEALGENNVWFFHGLTVTPEQIHVPLIMKLPKSYPLSSKSGTVDCPVSLLDLMPTILDMVGVEHTSLGLDGKSLFPALRDGKWEEMSQRRLLSENAGQYAVITLESVQVKPKPSHECGAAQRTDFLGCLYAPEVWARSIVDSYREAEEGATSAPPITWTGERYVPWVDLGTPEIHYEHLHRYYFALQFVEGKKVLDLASGEGYGCAILAEKAAQVVGVEIDEKAVKHAVSKYPLPNLEFIQGSITDVPIPGSEIFDVITCFEAIEHIVEHEKLLTEVKRLLKDDGLFIISSPNKLTYTDQPGYRNPYHVKELYFDEFKGLLTRYFPYVQFLGQKVFPVSAIWPLGAQEGLFIETCVRTAEAGFVRVGVQEKVPLYFIAIGSGRPLPEQQIFSTLTDVSEQMFRRLRQRAAEKEQLLTQQENELRSLRQRAMEQEEAIRASERLLEETRQEMDAALRASEELLAAKENEFAAERESLRSIIAQSEERIAELEESLSNLTKQLAEKNTEVIFMRSSLGWYLTERYRRLADRMFPSGTKRRTVFELGQKALKILVTAGPVELYKRARSRFAARRSRSGDYEGLGKHRPVALLSDEFIPFAFEEVGSPRASIIIPVFNKWTYTYNCLRSVRENTDGVPYEVIVVDNASTDETLEWLPRIGNLKVVHNAANEGFIAACNKGAKVARGEYLVFLNNDTLVRPGWLAELVNTLERDPEVGVVGAKLLYPDGSLQEAGGIVWSDGSGWNYGRGDRADRPQYNFVREVDYCSGACLAVKKAIFVAAGGFDARYAPAYFEDSDLCFTARRLGYKVMYQPRAKVVHFEGVTAGRDESQGVKSFQAVNRPKFVAKWESVLKEAHWPPEPTLVWRARRHGKKPEVLMVDHYVPEWDKDSGSFYMRQMINLFTQMGWNITFYPDNLAPLQPYTSELQQLGVEVIYGPTNFETFMKERRSQFDLALLRRPDFSFGKIDVIRRLSPNTKIIYDTSDLHFLREQRRAEVEGSEEARLASERYKAMELYLARTADVTFVVTEDERRHLLELDSSLKVEVIPNIHPDRAGEPPPFEGRSGLLFLGSYLHPPNVDAVKWFVSEIWPLVRGGLPEAEFYIVGSNVPDEIRRLQKIPGVRVVGWVPAVEAWFDRCRVFVCPLRYGAGMKGKIGHAMSHGLPVVTTTIGAEGIGLIDGETALVRDNPEEFAKAVVQLYRSRDLWMEISRKGIQHIRSNYSPGAVLLRVSSVLGELGCLCRADRRVACVDGRLEVVGGTVWGCSTYPIADR